MLVMLNDKANCKQVQAQLQGLGLWTRALQAQRQPGMTLLIEAHSADVPLERIAELEGVADVYAAPSDHPLIDAQARQPVTLGACQLAAGVPLLMAGPCSVESERQAFEAAAIAARCGARLLRGGAFKPRTSPYSFRGHGVEALGWLRAAANEYGLGVVTEVMSELSVDDVAKVADLLQIGSRNMQNYALLQAVGRAGKPVLLKRGMAATVHEWLLSGEHLMAAGAAAVIFCERGIQGIDDRTRNLLDLGAVALLKHVYGQPVVVDPSHAVGRRDLVVPLCRAALAAGADGLLVEMHPHACEAQSDGPQALDAESLAQIGKAVQA